jgi:hypothetical protein
MTITPIQHLVSVSPSDTTDLSLRALLLYIGTGGDVRVIAEPNTPAATFKNVPSGMVLAVRASRVLATGTTATDIVAVC